MASLIKCLLASLFLRTLLVFPTESCLASNVTSDLSASWTGFSPFLTCNNGSLLNADCLVDLADDPDFQDRENFFTFLPSPHHHHKSDQATAAAQLHTCHESLSAYGYQSSAFMGCAVNYSRPILLCEKCVELYLVAQQSYSAYNKAIDPAGRSCRDIVYGSDLIGVVGQANQSIELLWGESHCQYCFNSYYIDQGTVVYQYSDNLIIFMNKHRDLSECFSKYGIQMEFAISDDITNITNASAVCRECYPLYKSLSEFFLKNYTEDISRICMDVVDVMNQTRRMWGRYFQCGDRNPSMFLVWTVTIMIFAVTIVFYIGMLFNSSFEAYIIRRQDRLEEPHIRSEIEEGSSGDLSFAPL